MKRSSSSSHVATVLEARILSGELLPGTRIRQEHLAEEFSVSRMPIREAMSVLQSRGLVRLVPATGAWVSSLDLEECREIYLLRERLEPFLLGEAIASHTEDSLKELEQLVRAMEHVNDVSDFVDLDRQFHLSSMGPAGMPRLLSIAEQQWNSTQHYRRAAVQLAGLTNIEETFYEHRMILSSVRRKDKDSAEDLFAMHIRRTRLYLESRPEVFDS